MEVLCQIFALVPRLCRLHHIPATKQCAYGTCCRPHENNLISNTFITIVTLLSIVVTGASPTSDNNTICSKRRFILCLNRLATRRDDALHAAAYRAVVRRAATRRNTVRRAAPPTAALLPAALFVCTSYRLYFSISINLDRHDFDDGYRLLSKSPQQRDFRKKSICRETEALQKHLRPPY